MPRLPHPRKAQLPKLPRLPVRLPINQQLRVASVAEVLRARPVRSQRQRLAPEPVADVVRIAVDQRHLDVPLQQLLEVRQVRCREVAGQAEGVVDEVARRVVQVDAERVLDGRSVEPGLRISVLLVGQWRGRKTYAPVVWRDIVAGARALGTVRTAIPSAKG